MRILFAGDHPYPMPRVSSGLSTKAYPSGSAQRLHDWIAKGLAELGHEVLYYSTQRTGASTPPGVEMVDRLVDADILHTYAMRLPSVEEEWRRRGLPYIATAHLDPLARGRSGTPRENWVWVSRALAERWGSDRVVLNAVDPSEYVYSEAKDDYILFMAAMDWWHDKGLDTALALSQSIGFRLVVAGTALRPEIVAEVQRMCSDAGAEYRGDVQGDEKADLMTGARALLLPSRWFDPCPLTIIEALASGTPVIAAPSGGVPELVSEDVGFLCASDADYAAAFASLGAIAPSACRARVDAKFHYHRMAREYLAEYGREIAAVQTSRDVVCS